MDEKLFKQLIKSVREMNKISRDEIPAGRIFKHQKVDAKAIRLKSGLTQIEFAMLIGVSPRTLQNWEQGYRRPEGPALALLTIFKNDPQHAFNALHLHKGS